LHLKTGNTKMFKINNYKIFKYTSAKYFFLNFMYCNFDLIRIAPPGILSRNDVILITSSASSVLPRCFFFLCFYFSFFWFVQFINGFNHSSVDAFLISILVF